MNLQNNKNLLINNDSVFKNTFFQSIFIEWEKLDSNICSSPSHKLFRGQILEFLRPRPSSIFNVPNL